MFTIETSWYFTPLTRSKNLVNSQSSVFRINCLGVKFKLKIILGRTSFFLPIIKSREKIYILAGLRTEDELEFLIFLHFLQKLSSEFGHGEIDL